MEDSWNIVLTALKIQRTAVTGPTEITIGPKRSIVSTISDCPVRKRISKRQDVATPHHTAIIREYLSTTFPEREIGRRRTSCEVVRPYSARFIFMGMFEKQVLH